LKTWIDLEKVETPERIASMKKDARGYPIPHSVKWYDGVPDFRVIDPEKWEDAVIAKRCGICGGFLGAHMAFVGGPLSMENRYFTDLPMHRECAIYALKTCPFLAAPKFSFAQKFTQEVQVSTAVSDKRPERFGLGIAKKFKVVQLPQGDIALHADPFKSIIWFEKGVQVD
jgi:hypothetical protein